jgi:hypothetical protein
MALRASQLSGELAGDGEARPALQPEVQPEVRPIPIRVTSLTSDYARDLVCHFWLRLGYTPMVEKDAAEALLRR